MLFKSFTGLSVQQFDDIFKEIESKYCKYEMKRLSSRKDNRRKRERAVGAGRHFKLIVKDRVIMVLVLQALHNLHPDGISLWFGSKQCMQRYTKD